MTAYAMNARPASRSACGPSAVAMSASHSAEPNEGNDDDSGSAAGTKGVSVERRNPITATPRPPAARTRGVVGGRRLRLLNHCLLSRSVVPDQREGDEVDVHTEDGVDELQQRRCMAGGCDGVVVQQRTLPSALTW